MREHAIGPAASLLQRREPVGGAPSPRFSHPRILYGIGPRAGLLQSNPGQCKQ